MKVNIRAFGIAKDILEGGSISLDVESGISIAQLKNTLSDTYPDFKSLRSLAFAINEEYVDETRIIQSGDEVILIPPVSGG